MDLYVTFFSKRKNNKHLMVANGFSFGRQKKAEDVDVFFNQGCSTKVIHDYIKKIPAVDRIFCSLCYTDHLISIRPIVNEKWILGGPLASWMTAKGINFSGEVFPGYLEEYLGKSGLSCEFDPYFADLVKAAQIPHLFFNCNIGKGCYWSKCKFCDYRYYDSRGKQDKQISFRPDVGGILEQLHPMTGCKTSNAHLGTPAIPPKILRQLFESKRDRRVLLTVFIRADDFILDVFRSCKDQTLCENIVFSIGCESLSQYALDTLNKGTTTDNTIELAQLILERGGYVVLGVMDHYVFANRRMVTETLDSIKQLKEFICKFPKDRVMITNNGVTRWPTREAVSEFTDDFTTVNDCGGESYIANIPKDSEAFKCNKEISLALLTLEAKKSGFDFCSLQSKSVDDPPCRT